MLYVKVRYDRHVVNKITRHKDSIQLYFILLIRGVFAYLINSLAKCRQQPLTASCIIM